jgi:Ca2+-binding RTX toxin-like protein
VTQVNVKLAGTLAGSAGDGAADQVTVEATSGDDVAVISGDASGVSVAGLAAQVNVTGADGTRDQLQVNGGDGDDVLDASRLAAGAIGLVLDGGAGNDVIIGSAGDDVLRGGEGDDVIIGGGGHDIIDAGPGDNVVIQGFTSGEDRIDLRGIADAHDFAWVLAHAQDVDGSAVIDFGDGAEMKVADVKVASLHAGDFLLA